jgi:hypothetical protein
MHICHQEHHPNLYLVSDELETQLVSIGSLVGNMSIAR